MGGGCFGGGWIGNDIPGFRPGRYPAAPDDIQADGLNDIREPGLANGEGHGTLVPIPNGWRVFWRGRNWETISRASARDDIRLRRTIFRPGGLNDIREPGLANGGGTGF